MLFSYRWLKELSGTKRSPEKLAQLLITHAFEVESVAPWEHGLGDIVIGEVTALVSHPKADRLRVATVAVGRKDSRTIVCGAPNVAVGQKVAVILPGGTLPGGQRIEAVTLRGQKSEGMICSARELGLGMDHTGILVLPEAAPIGKALVQYGDLDDSVLDVKILPDRAGDALSYLGLAREIAALEGVPPAFEHVSKQPLRRRSGALVPRITLHTTGCRRYALAVFKLRGTAETPLQMRCRLIVSGLRPVSPAVDITNYLMLETGQPTHAFDLDAIGKSGLVVREAKSRESLTLLDGTKVALARGDLVIADHRRALALAGIMGGKASGVTETTKRIAIEIAHFDPAHIRITRKRLGIETDASYRFERALDADRPTLALPRLIRLMDQVGQADCLGVRDVYPKKLKPVRIRCRETDVEQLLGVKVPLFEMVQLLALLGLSVKKVSNQKEILVTVPTRRNDLREREDLIEEIGRMKGYGSIPARAPLVPLAAVGEHVRQRHDRALRMILRALGLDETLLYSFYSEKTTRALGLNPATHLRVANPMNPDQALMRESLLPNLLLAGKRNLRFFSEFALYEMGSVFRRQLKSPQERTVLGCVWFAPRDEAALFSRAKGALQTLAQALNLPLIFEPAPLSSPPFADGQSASLMCETANLGTLGSLQSSTLRALGLVERAVVATEIDLDEFYRHIPAEHTFQPLPRFPFVERDISLIGPERLNFRAVHALVSEAGAPLLRSLQLFDVYRTAGETSYAFHLSFGHPDRTLTHDEVETCFSAIVTRAQEKLGLRLRLEE